MEDRNQMSEVGCQKSESEGGGQKSEDRCRKSGKMPDGRVSLATDESVQLADWKANLKLMRRQSGAATAAARAKGLF